MSRLMLLVAASGVTLIGLAVVVSIVRWSAGVAWPVQRAVAWAVLCGYLALLWIQPPGWALANLAVLLAAAAGARLLSANLGSPGSVVVFLLTGAVVDLFSFSGGLTHKIIEAYREGTSTLLLFLCLSVPVNGRVIPVVGVGDLFMGGAAAFALMQAGVSRGRVAAAIAAGLLASLVVGVMIGGAPAVPGMAAACLTLVWWESRRPKGRASRHDPCSSHP